MKHRHSRTRQKMSRIIDELGAALFDVGAADLSLHLQKEPEGLRLQVLSDFDPSRRTQVERLCRLLQPEIRDPALAETFWALAGSDLESGTSEISLVGQLLDSARITLEERTVRMELFVCR